ncbi:ATP-dependent helicase HrpB [Vibrio algivorus]|uniref:ATP-dependent helicase HrpB n=1 Tax=Vibrio algivorus TaxID=1667024 RepID=A0A557P468_9VIBR|nr:ATP-dependent helicase HrpB [Vibrio algivorus]TVO35456.1 ATP-dependent helicase HrpB [Vibrio algivorus]
MSQLPIVSVIASLLVALRDHSQVILKAAPGAGKSTYLPKVLLQSGADDIGLKGKIIMMEPRRLAARNIAHYLAKQLGETVGQTVGFRVKGEAKVSANTRLEIVTEGVMTRMIQNDPELNGVGLVIFDEFHERSIHADTALAFCLEAQQVLRDDLKILLMSATLDQQALKTLMPQASYIESEGRGFPIDYHYAPLTANQYLVPRLTQLIPLWLARESGSMLVFLPGAREIRQLADNLEELDLSESGLSEQGIDICPLYGQLDAKTQQSAIAASESGRRKVVLATNIAETSLTIEGIRMVMDSGFERVAKFDPKTGITRLEQVMIAQSSAQQRAGRAGRLEPGVCIRLYSQEALKLQPVVPQAEILHSDLTSLQMELLFWGANAVDELSWLDLPPQSNLQQAKSLLKQLGLLTPQGQLTVYGQHSQKLGVEPRFAAMLLRAKDLGDDYYHTALATLAMLEEPENNSQDISQDWHRWSQGVHNKASVLVRRSQQVGKACGVPFDSNRVDSQLIGCCVALAFPDRIAQSRANGQGRFLLANGHGAIMDERHGLANYFLSNKPHLESDLIVAIDLMRSSHSMASQIFRAVRVKKQDIERIFIGQIESLDHVQWVEVRGCVSAEKQRRLGALVLEKQVITDISPLLKQAAILDYIRRKGLSILPWEQSSTNLLNRIRNGIEWMPEHDWPAMSDDILLAKLEQWLEPYMVGIDSVAKIKQIPLSQALLSYLGWPLNQEIDKWLPTHYRLPTGSNRVIRYQSGAEPVLSVRMQEVFGESDSPLIAQGRKKLVLELLSPAQRPLQITQDLAGFWQGAYKEVQKEMKGRYPKHVWPDDPANHVATTKTKRHFS